MGAPGMTKPLVQAYPYSAGSASQRLQARGFTAEGGGSLFFIDDCSVVFMKKVERKSRYLTQCCVLHVGKHILHTYI